MKKLFILFLIIFSANVYSSDIPDSLFHHFSIGGGFAFGPENYVSVIPPKLSLYYYVPEENYEKYAAIEFANHFIIVYFSSFDILAGIKSKYVSFDTSISRIYFPEIDYGYEYYPRQSYYALNPKIGVKLGYFWLKSGPSIIFLRKNFPRDSDIGKIGPFRFNFELSFQIPIKLPNIKKIKAFNNRQNE